MGDNPETSQGSVAPKRSQSASEVAAEWAAAARSRWQRLAVIGVVVLATLALGAHWLTSRWSHVVITDARIAASMTPVPSEVSGQVTDVSVNGGTDVAAGTVMIAIDAEQAELIVAGIRSEIDGVAARREQLRAQQDMIRARTDSRLEAARAQIAAAEANLASSRSGEQDARTRFDRISALAERRVASAQDLDAASIALDTARSQTRAAAASVETARANLAVIEAEAAEISVIERQIATLAAEQAGLEARLAQRRIDLERRQVPAAFDGVVDAVFVDPGEYVTPGTRMLIYHRSDEVWVDANVRETDFRKIALGATATFTVDAYPGQRFTGTVERLGGAATSQFALLPSPNPSGNFTKVTQRLPIRIAFDPGEARLRPGMMVELSVDVAD